MKLFFYSHPVCYEHNPGDGHPERQERLEAIDEGIAKLALREKMLCETPAFAKVEWLQKVHCANYVEKVLAQKGKTIAFDADTRTSPKSVDAALLAVGAAIEAVDKVLENPLATAFCCMRPPGHHAEKDRAMGFCLFNNAAVAAQYAIEDKGLQRVLIFDPDVHHGNGTEHIFYESSQVFYISIHQAPFYPGTGKLRHCGMGEGEGYNLNLPLPAGLGDPEYVYLTDEIILRIVENYAPQLIIFSAGFDAHALDPLGGMKLTDDGFLQMYFRVIEKAQQLQIPFLFLLEGGYSLEALSSTVAKLLDTLAQENFCKKTFTNVDLRVIQLVKELKHLQTKTNFLE